MMKVLRILSKAGGPTPALRLFEVNHCVTQGAVDPGVLLFWKLEIG